MSIKDKYKIREIPPKETHDWLLNKHYAGRVPPISIAFGLYNSDKSLVGVSTFASPPIQMNDGWCLFNEGDIREKDNKDAFTVKTMELNRLVVNDGLEKNTLSYFVSGCLNMLDTPLVVVSFADPTNGHHGYIYQATNWIYTGRGEIGGKSVSFMLNGRDIHGRGVTEKGMLDMGMEYDKSKTLKQNWKDNGGEVIKQKRKHRYLYFLGSSEQVKQMKSRLKYPVLPYPKGKNRRYDTSYVTKDTRPLFI